MPDEKPTLLPVMWAVTCDGEFTENVFKSSYQAEKCKRDLDMSHPENKREIVELFTRPLPAPDRGETPETKRWRVTTMIAGKPFYAADPKGEVVFYKDHEAALRARPSPTPPSALPEGCPEIGYYSPASDAVYRCVGQQDAPKPPLGSSLVEIHPIGTRAALPPPPVQADRAGVGEALSWLRDAEKALADLSFECDGVTQTVAPSRETYNRTFRFLENLRSHLRTSAPPSTASGEGEA